MSDLFYLLAPTWEAPDPTWRTQAACRGCDPDLFHPRRGQDVRAAKAVCADCPVADTCLEWAMRNNMTVGVWGGTSERERRKLRAQRRRDLGLPPGGPVPSSVHNIDWVESERICGTNTGYYRHRRRDEPACTPCLIAHRDYIRPVVARHRARLRGDAA